MSAPPPGDIVLNAESTRAVRTVNLAPRAQPNDNRISVDPSGAALTLDGDDARLSVNSGSDVPLSFFDSRNGRGAIDLRSTTANSPTEIVQLRSVDFSGFLSTIGSDGSISTAITSHNAGNPGQRFIIGGLAKTFTNDQQEGVSLTTEQTDQESGAGVLEVNNIAGNVSGRMSGRNATLKISDKRGTQPQSGSELVIEDLSWKNQPTKRDISVYATATTGGDFGFAKTNRPLIFLNGPEAMIGLGRSERPRVDREGSPRPGEGAGGRIRLYPNYSIPPTPTRPRTIFEAGIGWPRNVKRHQTKIRFGELTLRQGDVLRSGGTIRADDNGLRASIYNKSAGSEIGQFQVSTTGVIRIGGSLKQGAIPKAGPRVAQSVYEVVSGDTIDMIVFVGDGNSIDLQIGSQSSGYVFKATISLNSEQPLTLSFDTAAAGDSTQSTIKVDGVNLPPKSETSLNRDLPPGQYDLTVSDTHGSDQSTIIVESQT